MTYLFGALWIIISIAFLTTLTFLIIALIKKKKFKSYLISTIILLLVGLIFITLTVLSYQSNNVFGNKESTKSVTLKNGLYRVGDDINEGYYKIISKNNVGDIKIESQNKKFDFEESFGEEHDDSTTVPSITTYLEKGDVIQIEHADKVGFYPQKHAEHSKLSTGVYFVGKDIEPGNYNIKLTYPSESGGNFKIYTYKDKKFDCLTSEILRGSDIEKDEELDDKDELNVSLNKGEIVVVNGISSLDLK